MTVEFNNDAYESEGFKPLKNGWVNAQITDFGDDPNKTGTGEYVWFEFTLLEGDDKGRTLRCFYNYIHDKEDAQRIAREQICAIARFVDVKKIILPERLDSFLDKKIRIKISQKPNDDYPQIKDYAKFESSEFAGFGDLETSMEETPKAANVRDPFAN